MTLFDTTNHKLTSGIEEILVEDGDILSSSGHIQVPMILDNTGISLSWDPSYDTVFSTERIKENITSTIQDIKVYGHTKSGRHTPGRCYE